MFCGEWLDGVRRMPLHSPHVMRRITYLWQSSDWPDFVWDADELLAPLAAAARKQGVLLGKMAQLGLDLQGAARVQAVAEEASKSSSIEGEELDWASVRSSVARRLGVKLAGLTEKVDQKADGVVAMTLDATLGHSKPLTLERLIGWRVQLQTGTPPGLRTDALGPMQVVSGPIGKERVHFEAPPAKQLAREVKQFLAWFNAPPKIDGVLRAGLAHLWFVTIHPFDDGNGRVARAITDMALTQLEGKPERFYSLSSQLRRDRTRYYDMLEQTQKGPLDVTPWLLWFTETFAKAVDSADDILAEVLARAELSKRLPALNERQRLMMDKLLAGLEGKLTSGRWAALTKTSADTAQRDIKELLELKLVTKNPGGSKNTSYSLSTYRR